MQVHLENMKKYMVPVVVCLNKFETDSEEEIKYIKEFCHEKNAFFAKTVARRGEMW